MKRVSEVRYARAIMLKTLPPQWRITAVGTVPSTGWVQPRLEPRVYVVFPADGIQDFDFVADPPPGVSHPVLSAVRAQMDWPVLPQGVTGVRVHGVGNCVEARPEDAQAPGLGTEAPIAKETHAQCVARVKKDYPVPPGNINTQKQLIELECGKP